MTVQLNYAEPFVLGTHLSTSPASNAVRHPTEWTIEGSNDESAWDLVHTVAYSASPTETKARSRYQAVDSDVAYDHYRLTFLSHGGGANVRLAETWLYDNAGEFEKQTPTGFGAGNVWSGQGANLAADGNPATWAWAGANAPQWFRYDFAEAFALKRYRIYSGRAIDSPGTFTVSGSNDGTTWTPLSARTSFAYEGDDTWAYFEVENDLEFTSYRIDMTATQSGGNVYIRLYEWDLYAAVEGGPEPSEGSLVELSAAALNPTLSATPQIGDQALVAISASGNFANAQVTGLGATWSQIPDGGYAYAPGSLSGIRHQFWVGKFPEGSTPAAGTITITGSNTNYQARCMLLRGYADEQAAVSDGTSGVSTSDAQTVLQEVGANQFVAQLVSPHSTTPANFAAEQTPASGWTDGGLLSSVWSHGFLWFRAADEAGDVGASLSPTAPTASAYAVSQIVIGTAAPVDPDPEPSGSGYAAYEQNLMGAVLGQGDSFPEMTRNAAAWARRTGRSAEGATVEAAEDVTVVGEEYAEGASLAALAPAVIRRLLRRRLAR